MNFHKNDIIDYFDSRKISCGLVLEADERRLRILTDQGRETKIAHNRALTVGNDPHFPVSGTRDEQISRLKQISVERDELKKLINLRDLWEIVVDEASEISLEDLSDLFFGKAQDVNSAPSLLRAVFEERLHFRMQNHSVEVLSPERVEQALTQRRKEEERITFVDRCAEFLGRFKNDNPPSVEDTPEGLAPLLEEAACHGREWVTLKKIKEIFSRAGLPPEWDPFRVLVRLGTWSEDENIRLRAENVPIEFSPDALTEAMRVSGKPLPESAEDLTGEHLITIDAVTTRDVDDALSLSKDGADFIVGVHITDVAHFIEHDSLLDRDVRERATSIYLPEMIIPMIPPILSEEAASLTAEKVRPVLSTLIRFGPDLTFKDFRILAANVRVAERLSYEETDQRISDPASQEATLFAIAQAVRKERIASGALIFKDPELSVRVNADKTIEVAVRDRESPSQVLVSEMMILANSLFARFLRQRNLPGIFRTQAPPLERIELGDEFDPVVSYRSKKSLSRGDLGIDPAPHATLGLQSYTTATSPLRRYPDLLVQRQLKAALSQTGPLTRRELASVLPEISYRLDRASALERERQRYFLLKYLEARRRDEFEAIVLHRFPRFYLVQIWGLCLNAALHTPGTVSLDPYDRVIIRIDKINPREDKLSLSLVRHC